MNHHAFLIKEAVTTGALAGIAKRHGIPLLGDWRYATKLLHKAEKATPEGAKHYEKVLGFTTPTERRVLKQVLARGSTPWELFKLKMGPGKREVRNPTVHTIYSAVDTVRDLLLARGRTTFKGTESLEAGLHQPVGGARRLSTPGLFSVTYPKTVNQRSIHTHPDPMAGKRDADMDDIFQMVRVSPSAPDVRALTNPVMGTGVVYGPRKAGKEWESVYKGSKGQRRRLYYRGRE